MIPAVIMMAEIPILWRCVEWFIVCSELAEERQVTY
jgi:hypothetical protein